MFYFTGVLIAAFILVVYVTVRYEYLRYNDELDNTIGFGALCVIVWPIAILMFIAVGIGLIIKKTFKNLTGMKQ